MFLVVPNDDPGTHFVGYLKCHDGNMMVGRPQNRRHLTYNYKHDFYNFAMQTYANGNPRHCKP